MRARRVPSTGLGILVLAAALAAQGPPPAQAPPQPFRSRVIVVPVDVRVVDRNGKPIADLKPEDFTVTEDGVPQTIVHFSFQTLTPETGEVADRPPDFRQPLGETITAQNKRIFLIVLGTGRQVGPVKGVEAALKFMKERLLPQDQVAILAYNRATDFTTDHTRAIETLQRYREKHERIESGLRHHFSGLAAAHASREIPPHIQKEVDGIFRVPGALTSRSLAATGVTDAAQLSSDTRRTREQIQRAELAAERLANNMGTAFDQSTVDEAALSDLSFDEYVEKTSDTMADLGKLYGGIRYLRYLDGEKHLVFLTPNGLFLPRLENSNSIAALANDARVSIDIIHTYGMAGGSTPPVRLPASGSAAARVALNSAVPSAGVVFTQRFSIGSSRQISDLTGGRTTAFTAGDQAFRRLDESTRAQYLLGYSPTHGTWEGAYRRIGVKVSRKDVQVLYRHGYVARQDIKPLSRREYLSYSRIASAANLPRPIDDLKMQVGASAVQTTPEGTFLSVDVRIHPGAVKFARQGEEYIAQVEGLYFCADAREQLVGESWQTLDFKLTEDNYQKFMREGAGYTVRVPLKGEPKYLKVILYDYAADLVGSSMVQLQK
jgi:VWFA-related protein